VKGGHQEVWKWSTDVDLSYGSFGPFCSAAICASPRFATVINERDEFFIAADIDGVAAAGREVIEDEWRSGHVVET